MHLIFTPPLFQDADKPFNASIHSQDISDSGRGSGKICQVVEGIDKGKGGGAVQGSAVIEGGGDMDGSLVDIWDTEVDLSHDAKVKG